MKLVVLLLFASLMFGAIGDNAPSIPSTYVAVHPRLPYPDNTYLDNIWNNRAGGALYIWNDATGWSSAAPGNRIAMRHLLLAYLAEKRHSGPNVAAFLTQIQNFSQLNANWNLTTGNGYWDPAIALSMAFDWINADLGSTVRASICTSIQTMQTGYETNYGNSSPYNDQFYITGFKQMPPLMVAASVYPDCSGSITHLRWAMDMEMNMLWPAWKQVIGGATPGMNNACPAGTNSSTDCGGAWHEAWLDYVNKTEGLAQWYTLETSAWAVASGIDTTASLTGGSSTFFTVQNPWMKNFAYWTMYQVRPDFSFEPIEPTQIPIFDGETGGDPTSVGLDLGMLGALGEIYQDPTLRGWCRLVNWFGHTPTGYEPSGWPYLVADNSGNSSNGRSSLSTVRNFPGDGRLYVRTGWGENDTFCTFVYRDSYQSHPVQDAGALSCFNRGPLTIHSGSYGAGSASDEFQNYGLQAISQNAITLYDSSDLYNSETLTQFNNDGSTSAVPLPNDGGQRRAGSSISNLGGGSLQAATAAIADPAMWMRSREFYHMGRLVGYANGSGNKYTFAAADITDAYNNLYSRNAHSGSWVYNNANTSNRTFRAQKVVRQVTFVPQGTAMLVFIYDQVTSTNSGFVKKVLWHSINAPTITGSKYVIVRNELATSQPYPNLLPQQWSQGNVGSLGINNCSSGCTTSSTQYQFHGQLTGWLTIPSGGTNTSVGGSGHEFDITDTNGTANHYKCMQSLFLCTAGNGLGSVDGEVHPVNTSYPQQPGSYRIEQTVGASNLSDQFVNVQWYDSDISSNTVGTPTTSLSGGNYTTSIVLTLTGGTCTVTLVQPQFGVGGTVGATGAGCATTF